MRSWWNALTGCFSSQTYVELLPSVLCIMHFSAHNSRLAVRKQAMSMRSWGTNFMKPLLLLRLQCALGSGALVMLRKVKVKRNSLLYLRSALVHHRKVFTHLLSNLRAGRLPVPTPASHWMIALTCFRFMARQCVMMKLDSICTRWHIDIASEVSFKMNLHMAFWCVWAPEFSQLRWGWSSLDWEMVGWPPRGANTWSPYDLCHVGLRALDSTLVCATR